MACRGKVIYILLFVLVEMAFLTAAGNEGDRKNPHKPPGKIGKVVKAKNGITGSYIIRFKPGVSANDKAKGYEKHAKKVKVAQKLRIASMNGLSDNDVAGLEEDPDVDLIEQNQVYKVTGGCTSYSNPLWNLDKLDDYIGGSVNRLVIDETDGGQQVNVYVLDTGIDEKDEFTGRAFTEKAFVGSEYDDNGHGTHVAGIIGAETYGVARQAILHGIKTFNAVGESITSDILAAYDYVIGEHGTGGRTIMNLSFSGGHSQAQSDAIKEATDLGIIVVAAAGNDNWDAADSSPANAPTAITVAASNRYDRRSSFSNYGRVVEIFAPGENIVSLGHGGWGPQTKSGTSMAAPHVAGVIANYFQTLPYSEPTPNHAAVLTWLKQNAKSNWISNVPGSLTSTDLLQIKPCSSAKRGLADPSALARDSRGSGHLVELLLKILSNKE